MKTTFYRITDDMVVADVLNVDHECFSGIARGGKPITRAGPNDIIVVIGTFPCRASAVLNERRICARVIVNGHVGKDCVRCKDMAWMEPIEAEHELRRTRAAHL